MPTGDNRDITTETYEGMAVDICGVIHTITEVQDVFDSGEVHFGQIDHGKAEIVLNADLDEQIKEEALCHEIIHGILFHTGHQDLCGDEEFVQQMANAIRQSFDVKIF